MYELDNSNCLQCPQGRYSKNTASSECLLCANGYISNKANSNCISCKKGQYSFGNLDSDHIKCISCQIGKYSETTCRK